MLQLGRASPRNRRERSLWETARTPKQLGFGQAVPTYKYIVKTIPKWELSTWVDGLARGMKFLPVYAVQSFTHAIVLHNGRAFVLKIRRRVRSRRSVEMCGPLATEPVRANWRLYFVKGPLPTPWRAAVPGFRGLRYTNARTQYAR
jgi:hypothetical protein